MISGIFTAAWRTGLCGNPAAALTAITLVAGLATPAHSEVTAPEKSVSAAPRAASSGSAENTGADMARETAEAGTPTEAGPMETDRYLRDLGLIDGHLRAGVALFAAGKQDGAATHMKHPEDEIYAALVPGLEARGAPEFGDRLTELADLVEDGAPAEQVEAAHAQIAGQIDAARVAADAAPRETLLALAAMLRIAAEEYGAGIDAAGKVTDLHEYQDAWGFVAAARAQAERLAEETQGPAADAARGALKAIEAAGSAFGTLTPEQPIEGDAAPLLSAAGRIEAAAQKAG
ncbi:hypothetical protein [Profundibacterium mesophilum]|uniref:Uncharacterized protein n=1 Tax=Profundibacterium mesophilum KAUST100406-0324 TaxID=1037889 RepID=A0A921TCE1_9RHOB|nr:hypothetical protein [Profundibacterium mesophilum]KAF0675568.1 hypothetical protein PMES_02199 [Profundibacterium mesophilum KAUST100406-0324]